MEILLYCLLTAFLALLFASTASPLYATNFWTDTNIYFTIGRGLREGLMPYRDLFDHKGPLLYLLYGLAAGISNTDFSGVFLLEVLFLAAFLFLAFRFAGKAGASAAAFAAPPLAAMAVCGCRAFTQGGSAEEFCLPFLLLGMGCAAELIRPEEKSNGENKARIVSAALFGISAAAVFLIKYTDCGLFFGLGLFMVFSVWRARGMASVFRMFVWMLLGFLVLCALVFGYYALRGALSDCLRAYFADNLTSYSGAPMNLRLHVWNALAYLRTQSQANPVLAALTGTGILAWMGYWLRRGGKGSVFSALAFPAGAAVLLLTCYWGEMAHPYYALVFAATAVPGLCALLSLPGHFFGGLRVRYGLAVAALLTLLVPLPAALKPEMRTLRSVHRQEMPQMIFAAKMWELSGEKAPTLLDLTSLDQGFYLAAGVLPATRYFADNNLETAEKRTEIGGYLTDGVCEYVVTVWREPGENYECIAEGAGLFDLAAERTYRLWRRKTGL